MRREGRSQSWRKRSLKGLLTTWSTKEKKRKCTGEKEDEARQRIHKGYLEEKEKRNISRQLTDRLDVG